MTPDAFYLLWPAELTRTSRSPCRPTRGAASPDQRLGRIFADAKTPANPSTPLRSRWRHRSRSRAGPRKIRNNCNRSSWTDTRPAGRTTSGRRSVGPTVGRASFCAPGTGLRFTGEGLFLITSPAVDDDDDDGGITMWNVLHTDHRSPLLSGPQRKTFTSVMRSIKAESVIR